MTRHAGCGYTARQHAIPCAGRVTGGIGARQARARGTTGDRWSTTTPRLLSQCGVGSGRHCVHPAARDCGQRTLPGHVQFTALRRGRELIKATALSVPRRAAYIQFKQPASRLRCGGRVCGADGCRGVHGRDRCGTIGLPPRRPGSGAQPESHGAAAAAVPIDDSELSSDLRTRVRATGRS